MKTEKEHKTRHQELHLMLDELITDFIQGTGHIPSETNLMDLMQWSFEQAK